MTKKIHTTKSASAVRCIITASIYTMKKRGVLLLSWLIIVVLVILALGLKTSGVLGVRWDLVQNLATILTLVIAVLIWLSERYREWNESLSKRLTVRFVYNFPNQINEKEVMVCEEAYLAGESDIRAWAQQLGSQMSDGEMLHFFPSLDQSKPHVLRDTGDGRLFVHYTVSVRLRKLPKSIDILTKEASPNYPLVRWTPPDYKDLRYPEHGHPAKPGSIQKQTP